MFRRIVNIVLLGLVLVVAGVTYSMKHKAEVASERVQKLERDIQKEKDNTALLRAEWSVLTQPGRLQGIVDAYSEHFKLAPFSPDQVAAIDDIPMRPTDAKPIVPERHDPIGDLLTGSIN